MLTSIAVGGIVWAAERWAWIKRPRTLPKLPGLQERMWQALGRPMQVRGGMLLLQRFACPELSRSRPPVAPELS